MAIVNVSSIRDVFIPPVEEKGNGECVTLEESKDPTTTIQASWSNPNTSAEIYARNSRLLISSRCLDAEVQVGVATNEQLEDNDRITLCWTDPSNGYRSQFNELPEKLPLATYSNTAANYAYLQFRAAVERLMNKS